MNKYEQRCALTMFDDVQRHASDCACGDCEGVTGRSFGVAIHECKNYDGGASHAEVVGRALADDLVVERVYAKSVSDAREKARLRTIELGYHFVGDI